MARQSGLIEKSASTFVQKSRGIKFAPAIVGNAIQRHNHDGEVYRLFNSAHRYFHTTVSVEAKDCKAEEATNAAKKNELTKASNDHKATAKAYYDLTLKISSCKKVNATFGKDRFILISLIGSDCERMLMGCHPDNPAHDGGTIRGWWGGDLVSACRGDVATEQDYFGAFCYGFGCHGGNGGTYAGGATEWVRKCMEILLPYSHGGWPYSNIMDRPSALHTLYMLRGICSGNGVQNGDAFISSIDVVTGVIIGKFGDFPDSSTRQRAQDAEALAKSWAESKLALETAEVNLSKATQAAQEASDALDKCKNSFSP